ncbi:MAG: tetratricopeptide repeat protein [Candidatus Obscuribacterales bacterium]|nr:tetratricopeptide repeat protein [Candidatus Obscuribacterales bacterium]
MRRYPLFSVTKSWFPALLLLNLACLPCRADGPDQATGSSPFSPPYSYGAVDVKELRQEAMSRLAQNQSEQGKATNALLRELRQAEAKKDNKEIFNALAAVGHKCTNDRDYHDALVFFESALSIQDDDIANGEQLKSIYKDAANCCIERRQPLATENYLKKYLSLPAGNNSEKEKTDLAQVYYDLALALDDQGKLAEAEAATQQGLKALGPKQELGWMQAKLLTRLASLKIKEHKEGEAESIYLKSISIARRQVIHENEKQYAGLLLGLSDCYGAQQKYSRAIEVLKQAIRIYSEQSQWDSNRLRLCYNKLGQYLAEQKRYSDAEAALLRAYALTPVAAHQPNSHDDLFKKITELKRRSTDSLSDAAMEESILRAGLQLEVTSTPINKVGLSNAQIRVAKFEMTKGDFSGAILLFEKAEENIRAIQASLESKRDQANSSTFDATTERIPNTYSLDNLYLCLAKCFRAKNARSKAAEYYQKAIELRANNRDFNGENSTRWLYALYLIRNGELQEAQKLYEKTNELGTLASLCRSLRKPDFAETVLLAQWKKLKDSEASDTEPSIETVKSLIDLEDMERSGGKSPSLAEERYKTLISKCERANNPYNLYDALDLLAYFQFRQKQYAAAELTLRKELALNTDDRTKLEILYNLSLTSEANGELTQAEKYLEQATALSKKVFSNDQVQLSSALQEIAKFYQRHNMFELAEQNYKEALNITAQLPTREQFSHYNDLLTLVAFYRSTKQIEKGKSFLSSYLKTLPEIPGDAVPPALKGREEFQAYLLRKDRSEHIDELASLDKAILESPERKHNTKGWLLTELVWLYQKQGKYTDAKKLVEAEDKQNPGALTRILLARIRFKMGELDVAEKEYEKEIISATTALEAERKWKQQQKEKRDKRDERDYIKEFDPTDDSGANYEPNSSDLDFFPESTIFGPTAIDSHYHRMSGEFHDSTGKAHAGIMFSNVEKAQDAGAGILLEARGYPTNDGYIGSYPGDAFLGSLQIELAQVFAAKEKWEEAERLFLSGITNIETSSKVNVGYPLEQSKEALMTAYTEYAKHLKNRHKFEDANSYEEKSKQLKLTLKKDS